jgi:hypothetical protein
MLKRGPLRLVIDYEHLHDEAPPNESLCCREIRADPVGDELRPKVGGLISHEVILVHALP